LFVFDLYIQYSGLRVTFSFFDLICFVWVKWFWDLTWDFWAEKAKEKWAEMQRQWNELFGLACSLRLRFFIRLAVKAERVSYHHRAKCAMMDIRRGLLVEEASAKAKCGDLSAARRTMRLSVASVEMTIPYLDDDSFFERTVPSLR
jgi:hypothetical protein